MKKSLVALGLLTSMFIGTQSFAACGCNHSYSYQLARPACPCQKVIQPCCPAVTPCPAAPCASPCATGFAAPCGCGCQTPAPCAMPCPAAPCQSNYDCSD